MDDIIRLTLDGAEAHVMEAALAIYRAQLHEARSLGGPAQEAAVLMDGPAARLQAKLHDELYGSDEAPEPDWSMPEPASWEAERRAEHDEAMREIPEQADPITAAKALTFDAEGTVIPDDFAGDHHIYPVAS